MRVQVGVFLSCAFAILGGYLAPPLATMQTTRLGKRLPHLQGKPVPLFWAFGLSDESHLREYKSFGFNVAFIDVPWPQSGNVDELRGVLAHRMNLVRAAAREGLACVIGIEMAPARASDDTQHARIDAGDENYARELRKWLDVIIQNFGSLANVIAYATQHDPYSRLTLDDAGFREWLRALFESPQRVGARWGLPLIDWREVTIALPLASEQQKKLPLSLASLDVAMYRWATTTRMLHAWAAELRQRDPDKLIFTGRLRDYKTLASVPRSYDIAVPCAIPGEVEVDPNSHNPHAVDLARRGGALAAIPCLMTAPNQAVREEALQRQGYWLREAFLHGASGACFENWNDLRGNEGARARIRSAIEDVARSGIAESAPTPTSAIVHQPLADAAEVRRDNRTEPLYGFLNDKVDDEPMTILFAHRRGTRYGQVELLGVDSLGSTPLHRYGALFLPSVFHLERRTQEALAAYVFTGGVAVADLGLGAFETNGRMNLLPDTLSELFGVVEVTRWLNSDHNLVFPQAHPLFPSVEEWTGTKGNLTDEKTVGGLLGIARLYPDSMPFGIAVIEPKSAAKRRQKRPLPSEYSSVSVHEFGRGYGVFAPFRLWANWLPQHDGYQEFHHDLHARSPLVELSDLPGLFADGPEGHIKTDQMGLTGAAFTDGYAFFNGEERVRILSANVVGFNHNLLSDAELTYLPNPQKPLSSPPHRRWGLGPLFGDGPEPPQVASVRLLLGPGELRFCRFLPVQLSTNDGLATAQVEEYSKQRVSIKVWAPIASMTIFGNRRVEPPKPRPMSLRFRVTTGEYLLAPRSQQLVQIVNLENNRTERGTMSANSDGVLEFERKAVALRITIEPMAAK